MPLLLCLAVEESTFLLLKKATQTQKQAAQKARWPKAIYYYNRDGGLVLPFLKSYYLIPDTKIPKPSPLPLFLRALLSNSLSLCRFLCPKAVRCPTFSVLPPSNYKPWSSVTLWCPKPIVYLLLSGRYVLWSCTTIRCTRTIRIPKVSALQPRPFAWA